ncbi:hypothetical protein ZIOFF_041458 [Zingiber officinale]|uniref:Survival Motor Neuron Gemin2-binding domain-containing protein n=1 Tax=Zingiber officinale TaxID=94328 RepID=A0A8J5G536_ZINOF|nr:hypothetical protein ZIOFF_041458 [Zingiber officinale]
MGKGHELWDDSALIDAFDRSMTTYKKMHKESYPDHSFADENNASESNHDEALHSENSTRPALLWRMSVNVFYIIHLICKINEGLRVICYLPASLRKGEHNVDQENLITNVAETCMPYYQDVSTNEVLQSQETLCANICAPELKPHFSETTVASGEASYGNDQRSIEYNDLLNQYYELEEKRQQVLQQLQHAYYWYPQNLAQSGEYQAEKVPPNHASENFPQHPCSWCSRHCVTVPVIPAACASCCASSGHSYSCSQGCPSLAPAQLSDGQGHTQSGLCSIGPSCTVDVLKKISPTDDTPVKIGMMTAEKILSSVKSKISLDSVLCGENVGKDKEKTSGEHEFKASTSSDIEQNSDLVTVFSAWYSAGFHTGRQDSDFPVSQ